ncbi:MAG: hypothetical protein JSW58_08165 [Candidatus Latescibacterota bacterium]|nr:MAG: hypothetical protein JSW58_08165 [Candidatus Latescibacterota bacterium]
MAEETVSRWEEFWSELLKDPRFMWFLGDCNEREPDYLKSICRKIFFEGAKECTP